MIVFKDVSKNYNSLIAVNKLNLVIKKGEFFGLLGPNGAGKTTTIRMLSSLTPPSFGSIKIADYQVDRNATKAKSKIGIVSQHLNLEREISAEKNLELHARLFKMPRKQRKARISELLHYIGLYERRKEKIKNFSGGMKRKIMIARALLHNPEILLLDEPTVGLDATIRRKLWDLMTGLNKEGLTVLLTTHYIEEAQLLCNKVGFIDNGNLIALGTPTELVEKYGKFVLECFNEENGETQSFFFNDRHSALKRAADFKNSVKVRPANLEDTFIKLTNKKVGS